MYSSKKSFERETSHSLRQRAHASPLANCRTLSSSAGDIRELVRAAAAEAEAQRITKEKSNESQPQGLLNRHIGSIRRLLGRRGTSFKSSKPSPVITLEHSDEEDYADEEDDETVQASSSSRRRSNRGASNADQLSVPNPGSLYRSHSLNLLSEAFTAVHNLCVIPANAGKSESQSDAQSSRSGSPVLSSSPPAATVASAVCTQFVDLFHQNPLTVSPKSALRENNKSSLVKCDRAKNLLCFHSSAPDLSVVLSNKPSNKLGYRKVLVNKTCKYSFDYCSGCDEKTNLGTMKKVSGLSDSSVLTNNSSSAISIPGSDMQQTVQNMSSVRSKLSKTPSADASLEVMNKNYNDLLSGTIHNSFDDSLVLLPKTKSSNDLEAHPEISGKKKKISPKRRNPITATLRKLRSGSVSPMRAADVSSSDASSTCSQNTPTNQPGYNQPWTNGGGSGGDDLSQPLNSCPSSSNLSSLPPLAAPKDRCNCTQAPSTPLLSRSKAFRDSKRDFTASLTSLQSSVEDSHASLDSAPKVKTFSSSNGMKPTSTTNGCHRVVECSSSIASVGSVNGTANGRQSFELLPDRLEMSPSGHHATPSVKIKSKKALKTISSKYSPKKIASSSKSKHSDTSPKKKKSPRYLVVSHPSSLHVSPQHSSKSRSPIHKEYSSLQSLVESGGRAKNRRPTRKERLKRNRNALIYTKKNCQFYLESDNELESIGSKNETSKIKTKSCKGELSGGDSEVNEDDTPNKVRSSDSDGEGTYKEYPDSSVTSPSMRQHQLSAKNRDLSSTSGYSDSSSVTNASNDSKRKDNGVLINLLETKARVVPQSSCECTPKGSSSGNTELSAPTPLHVSASSDELIRAKSKRKPKKGDDTLNRPQSWSSDAPATLPGVAAAIGTMMAMPLGGKTPSSHGSPVNSPALMSPYASTESLLGDDDEDDDDDEVVVTASQHHQTCGAAPSTSATILGAISTNNKSFLYGGLDSLLGPRELDRCHPTRTISILISTWNMNGKEPPSFLDDFNLCEEVKGNPDMVVVGTQESGAERRAWEVKLQCCLGQSYVLMTSAVLGILHLNIFIKRHLVWNCSMPEDSSHSLRPGTYFKTKGAIAISFQLFGSKFLFINSHLFAHEEKQAQRIQNVKNISRSLDLPRNLHVKHKYKDITRRFDCVFWLGDFNFRLATNRDYVLDKLKTQNLEQSVIAHLLQWDQLSMAKNKGEIFQDFEEGEITFPPTFKYDPGTDDYDSSSKQRVPSYTDRIMFKSPRASITCMEYGSSSIFRTSDHKPVYGLFSCKIKPGKDDMPLNAGQFNRDVYVDALKKTKKLQQLRLKRGDSLATESSNCTVQ